LGSRKKGRRRRREGKGGASSENPEELQRTSEKLRGGKRLHFLEPNFRGEKI
jgi:hypothetical protein